MTNRNYSVCTDEWNGIISITYGDKCDYLDSFISIWVDDDDAGIPSPFKDIESAEIFAKAMVKLLKSVESVVDDV